MINHIFVKHKASVFTELFCVAIGCAAGFLIFRNNQRVKGLLREIERLKTKEGE